MTHKGALERAMAILKMVGTFNGPKYREGSQPTWRLEYQGLEAMHVCRLLYPYLVVKKPQADLLFDFAGTIPFGRRGGLSRTAEQTAKMKEIREQFHYLNRRGIAA